MADDVLKTRDYERNFSVELATTLGAVTMSKSILEKNNITKSKVEEIDSLTKELSENLENADEESIRNLLESFSEVLDEEDFYDCVVKSLVDYFENLKKSKNDGYKMYR